MRVLFFPDEDGVDVSGGAAELVVLALALAAGKGGTETTASAEPSFGGTELASVEVVSTSGPGVRIRVDSERSALLIEGDRLGLAALADEVQSIAEMDDGGHRHIEYFPDHHYLVAGSLAMVVNSPHGGMPTR
ncbi:Imm32 family immunity protein [Streptomyces goshikiensis]|uniref:Imm32 family immunity protein n=1 Tax=Streptomyces goshikiensis TaxID=1942 RepID=UPI00370224EE